MTDDEKDQFATILKERNDFAAGVRLLRARVAELEKALAETDGWITSLYAAWFALHEADEERRAREWTWWAVMPEKKGDIPIPWYVESDEEWLRAEYPDQVVRLAVRVEP